MMRTKYLRILQALLPSGTVWTRETDRVLTRLLTGIASVLAAIDERLILILNEADPVNSDALLADWERVTGLPDPCLGTNQTQAQRRDRLRISLTPPTTSNPADMVATAARLGYPDTKVIEPKIFRANSPCNAAVNDEDWAFTWILAAPNTQTRPARPFNARSNCNEPLSSWDTNLLECVIKDMSPIHTKIVFIYGGSAS